MAQHENIETLEAIEIDETNAEETAITATNGFTMTSYAQNLMNEVREKGYYATFPVETMDDKKKLFHAKNDNIMVSTLPIGSKIDVEDFVIDAVQINNPSGGLDTVPAVHIITPEGNVYQSASSGIVKSVCDIIASFGEPSTWDSTLTVIVKEIQTRNGFRYKFLDVK